MPLATSVSANASSSENSSSLKIALSSDIDSLNPFLAIFATSTNILRFQYDSLVGYSAKDFSEVPALASEWETSNGGKTWTFTIPDDRKWSDGKRLTAEDAAWTFNAIKKNDELKVAHGSALQNIESVTAPDPTTLVINLASPQAPNPGTVLPIVPKHVWAELDQPAKFNNAKNTVGSGPFVIKEYTKGTGVTMTANTHFYRGAPSIDEVDFVRYKSSDAAVAALRSGEIDFVSDLTPAQYQALKDEDGITVNVGDGTRYTSMSINPGVEDRKGRPMGNGAEVLHDKAVRKAIYMGIDNETLLKKVFNGLGELATGEVPAAYPQYHWDTDPKKLPHAFNPEKANELLDEAGYQMGSNGFRLNKKGEPIELRLLGVSTDPTHQQMANYIKPWLKDIGIKVTVSMNSFAQANTAFVLGEYDLTFNGWGMMPDPDFQMSINQCSSRPNADGSGPTTEAHFCSAEFDKLFKEQHRELNQEKRSQLIIEMQKLIYQAAINDPILYPASLEAYNSDRFAGFVKQPAKTGVITGQSGYWGLYNAEPVGVGDRTGVETGFGNTEWIIAGAVVVALAIGATVLIRRRRATQGERE
ncbi:ABC transporter substrate-binding protein [Arthrobacter pigmenti]